MHTALTPDVTPANDTRRDDLFAVGATIAGLDADNDTHRPHVPASPARQACIACHQYPAQGADGLCAPCSEEVLSLTPRRCPGGCHGGLVADPHGPSKHNPTGLRECPVCG